MDRSLIAELRKRPNALIFMIAVTTTATLFLNGLGILIGISNVLPHLFYIPIILTAYFFPRRGVLFAVALSFIYCSMAFSADPRLFGALAEAAARSALFVLIAAVVSLLTNRLHESEQQFRGVADRSSDVILVTDLKGRARYISPSIRKVAGWEPADIIGQLPGGFIHPEDIGRVMDAIPLLARGTSPGPITVRFRRKDGNYAVLEFSGSPVLQDGTVTGIQVTGRDVTERRKQEEARREAGRRLEAIIAFLPDPTMVVDEAGTVVAWNRAMEVITGIPSSSVLGKKSPSYTAWLDHQDGPILIDYVLRQDIAGIKAAYPNAHFEGNTVRTERVVTRADGTQFSLWISATPLIDEQGAITGAIESLRDVTRQKNISRALRESRQFLRTVINTIPVRVFWKDKNLIYLGCNAAFARDAGFGSAEDIIGKDDFAMGWHDQAERYRADDRAVIESGKPRLLIEEPQTTPSGETIYLLTSKVPLEDETGRTIGVLGTYMDISEKKLAEEALRQANRKLNLLSGITRHDIRNQLLGLDGYLEISKETLADPATTAGFIEKEQKITRTISHQLDFAKDYEDVGVKAPVWQNVKEIVGSVAGRLPMRGIRVGTGGIDHEIFADRLLEKVFYNLLDNALTYGGDRLTAIRVTAREENRELVIAVEDDGAGIPARDKPLLFTRGFGRHTGLGLYLSREILSITGITITENGEPGKGARFEIRVPDAGWRPAGEVPAG